MKSFMIIALLVLAVTQASAAEYFVSANGSDRNPGTRAKPFATLERARDAVLLTKKSGPITVWIKGWVYPLKQTFTLTPEDSGAEAAPITYRACEGEEVCIIGGIEVKGFKPVTDPAILKRFDESARGKVLQADLKAQGITDFGGMTPRGFGRPITPAGIELFFDDKPMTLARWPNEGWEKIASAPEAGKFGYESDRPKRWAKSDDIWVHGYWTWDWADSYERIKSIDTESQTIETYPPHGIYGYKAGKRFYYLNILEELDEPGEWCLDRTSRILYFWPPGKGSAYVSLLETPLISINGVSHTTIRGLTLECTRGAGIEVKGGDHVLIAGCTLRNIGTVGVSFEGGTKNGILSCDISQTGDGGIKLDGGDRMSLTLGENFATNNHIYNFNRWCSTYRPAVLVTGCGNIVSHNLMHDSPHTAILFNGNEHVMEFNEIHHVCMETSDAGGIYTGRDFSWRGNVIRYNYLHHLGTADVRAIYIDDCSSDVRIYGNLLYKAKMGVCIGGGRDCVVENNTFVDCRPSVFLDARGMNWAKGTVDGFMKERLEAMPYRESPWKERYPELLTLYDDDPGAPKYNSVARNVSFGGRWLQIIDPICEKLTTFEGNLVDQDPGFVDPSNGDFQLRDYSPAYQTGFKRIPVERIGLYMDEYRTKLPPKDEGKPVIRKLGTIDCDMVETTPIVFKDRLYRFEYVRDQYYKPNLGKPSYFRFVDVKTGEYTPSFAEGFHLGSAHVEGDTVYVCGVDKWGGTQIRVFWSKDLKKWSSATALDLPGWGIFNNSVCKGKDRYIMAFEIGAPEAETGAPFTMRFAESKDLIHWTLMPSECVFAKDRYTACPAIRFLDGRYYMIYLEALPGPTYEPHIVRTKDLIHWETSPLNPVMKYSFEDKLIANSKLTAEERDRIAKAVNINNSDIDLCEFEGKTIIVYSWGNQQGVEHLAEAVYDGSLAEFLRSWFP